MSDDPGTSPPYRLGLSPLHPLDREVAAGLSLSAPWRRAALLAALSVLVGGVVLGFLVILARLPTGRGVDELYGLVAAALAAALVWWAALPIATVYGGWRAAFGFDLPARGDGFEIVRWSAAQVLVRFVLAVVLTPLLPDGGEGGNLEGASDLPTVALVAMGVGAVLVAPVLEELIFRGVLLRALMRRVAFGPAAVISSGVFGLLHLGGVSTWGAGVAAVAFTLVFGVLQCVLVRRTGRLGPAMGVHAVTNLFFIGIALAAGA